MIVVAADIGGTHARLQYVKQEPGRETGDIRTYTSRDFPSCVALLERFFSDCCLSHVDGACFGLPGPVSGDEAVLTNLPWRISVAQLQAALPLGQVQLVNDLQAAAYGLEALDSLQLECLLQGETQPGNRLLIGVGTGLGMATLCRQGGAFVPQASEGGHIAFAPQNEQQRQLLEWFWRQYGYAAYEDLLSGDGLVRLYRFCVERANGTAAADILPAQVAQWADQGQPAACQALDLFATLLGQFVGDVALLWPAPGGIFLAGGVAAKLSRWLQSEPFRHGFLHKDRMSGLVEALPVWLVKDEQLGLKGALRRAQQLAG